MEALSKSLLGKLLRNCDMLATGLYHPCDTTRNVRWILSEVGKHLSTKQVDERALCPGAKTKNVRFDVPRFLPDLIKAQAFVEVDIHP